MKTYSIIIVCLTLGIFYGLAVKMEHQKNLAEQALNNKILEVQKASSSMDKINSSCAKHSIDKNDSKVDCVYYDHHDGFSLQVTGKERRYLNTGISYISSDKEMYSNHVDDRKIAGL